MQLQVTNNSVIARNKATQQSYCFFYIS